MNALAYVNVTICLATVAVAFFAMVTMRKDETEAQILLAFPTVAAGLVGAAIAYFRPGEWGEACNTLAYGGMLALLIGSRRRTHWIAPRWCQPLSVFVSLGAWVLFFVFAGAQ